MMRAMQLFFAIIAVFVLQLGVTVYAFWKSPSGSNGELHLANI
jgi:hypothetical protein